MQELKLQDFLGFHFLSALKLSANGHIACFLVSQCNHKLNCYTRNLWSINTITRQVIQLTENQNLDSFLWLDENTILFQASQNGLFLNPVSEFKLLRLDGGEAQPAFRIPLLVESIKAISQSRFIVQAKTTRSATEDLIESGATWTILDELPFAENGAGFVSGVRHRLYLYDSVEQSLSPITDESFQVRGEFVVHPDGSKVAYMGMHISHMEEQKLGIYLYDVAMGTTKQLLPLYRYKLRHIDFLGDKVLFTGADGSRYVWSQNAWFYTLDIQTGSEQVLFPSEQMPINNSINSDCRYGSGSLHKVLGSSVYHVITQDGSAHLVKTTQNKQEVVSKTAGSIDCVDIIGQTAYMIATRGNQLQEVYTLDLSSGEEHCLTCFNEDYVKTHEIGTPVSCDFQNANGDWIQGWVLPPSKYVQGKKYPAILEIHGGPKTAYSSVYNHEMQVLSNSGYFVFFCNPRGSDGKGDEFGFLMTRYGTVDYDDIMAFKDTVLRKYPDIDSTRLGVTGGSYGGYMTNWIIGHTNQFAAAVSQRSISNWITDEGGSDWSFMYSPCRFGGVPARLKLNESWASSPLKYADMIETPTLFIHSEEDFRCPLGEALQLYTNMINRGVKTKLVLFKDENHELSRSGKPLNRIKRLEEMRTWMDTYLKS